MIAATTSSNGVDPSGAEAAPSEERRAWYTSVPTNSTSRLSAKCRKNVRSVSPVAAAMSCTVVCS